MSLSGMNLVQKEMNYYVDEDTDTKFEFLFHYEVFPEEADKRIYAYFRQWQDTRPKEKFHGRSHLIPQTGKIDLPP